MCLIKIDQNACDQNVSDQDVHGHYCSVITLNLCQAWLLKFAIWMRLGQGPGRWKACESLTDEDMRKRHGEKGEPGT